MKTYFETDLGKLYNCDCLEILPNLDRVDLVLTDPPYGISESSKKNNSRGKLAKPTYYGFYDWDKNPADKKTIELIRKISKYQIIWGGNYFDLPPSSKWLVWDKLNSGDFADCELAWTNICGAVRIFRHMWNGMLRASERNTKRVHPTQKPIALMQWCLSFAPGDVVDAFMGSGTTAIACENLGRQWIGIEISEKYCEIAAKRIERERQQLKLFGPEETKINPPSQEHMF